MLGCCQAKGFTPRSRDIVRGPAEGAASEGWRHRQGGKEDRRCGDRPDGGGDDDPGEGPRTSVSAHREDPCPCSKEGPLSCCERETDVSAIEQRQDEMGVLARSLRSERNNADDLMSSLEDRV